MKKVIKWVAIAAVLVGLYFLLKDKLPKFKNGTYVPPTEGPPPPDVVPPTENQTPIDPGSAFGKNLIQSRAQSLWNSSERSNILSGANLQDPYASDKAKQAIKPLHYASAGTSTYYGLPWKNSYLHPVVRETVDELKGLKDSDIRDNPNGTEIKLNWYEGLNTIFDFPFQPNDPWAFVKANFGDVGNTDGIAANNWDAYYQTVDTILSIVGQNMDAIGETLYNRAIADLQAAGYEFIGIL